MQSSLTAILMIKMIRFILLLIFLSAGYQLLAQTEAYFEIRNTKRVGTVYEFDVHMRASQGGTFHSRGQIYMYYSQAAFGNTVVSNSKVTVTERDLLTEPDLFGGTKYQTVNVTDNGNRIAVTWQMVYQSIPASLLTHTILPDTFTPLYHFAIEMVNINASPGLHFDRALMGAQQFYLAPNTTNEVQYTMSLPVTWSYLEAEKIYNRDVKLRWGTEAESNNDYFVIEKDIYGDGVFTEIGQVAGSGSSSSMQAYSFLDQGEMGERNYYRLRQIDFNGSYSYSDILEVTFEYRGQARFRAYPVPMKDNLTLLAETKDEIPYRYRLLDVFGKEMLHGTLGAFERMIDIPVGHLPPGNYVLLVQGKNQRKHSFRLTK